MAIGICEDLARRFTCELGSLGGKLKASTGLAGFNILQAVA